MHVNLRVMVAFLVGGAAGSAAVAMDTTFGMWAGPVAVMSGFFIVFFALLDRGQTKEVAN